MKLSTAFVLAATAGSTMAFSVQPAGKVMSVSTARFMSEEEVAEEVVEEAPPAPVEPSYTCISKAEILAAPDTTEFGQVWDPLGLAEWGSDETLAWFRHSEFKHGRIAMAAFVGWCVVGAGFHFPGNLATDLPFGSIPTKGLEAWDAVPGWGKAQLLIFAGLVEFHDEIFFKTRGTHYLRGGVPGKNMVPGLYDPLGFSSKLSAESKSKRLDSELKNGRLAMIGIASLYAAATVPGSVPFIPSA